MARTQRTTPPAARAEASGVDDPPSSKAPIVHEDLPGPPADEAPPFMPSRARARQEVAQAQQSAPPTHRAYRVWEHGTLQRDGRTHQPGEVLTLPVAEGDAIPCLSPA